METVEVVIRIPEKYIEGSLFNGIEKIMKAVREGTVLPKGHGKLIDSNVLWDAFQDLGQDFYEAFDFAEANAVMEADKEAEDETD